MRSEFSALELVLILVQSCIMTIEMTAAGWKWSIFPVTQLICSPHSLLICLTLVSLHSPVQTLEGVNLAVTVLNPQLLSSPACINNTAAVTWWVMTGRHALRSDLVLSNEVWREIWKDEASMTLVGESWGKKPKFLDKEQKLEVRTKSLLSVLSMFFDLDLTAWWGCTGAQFCTHLNANITMVACTQ